MLWKPQDRGQVEVAPKKQTGGLRVTLLPFEVFRTPIAQRLVQTPAVIEALDVFEDRLTGLGLILELPMPDQFILERTKEALDRGVVVAVALAAHAQDDTPASEQRLVETRRVLVALVAMMQEPRRRAPVPPRHQPRLDDDRGALALTHGPAHPRREYRSSNTATYSQPVRVGMKVRSPAHTRFLAGTANRCARRLGIIAGSCWRACTVRTYRRRRRATSPARRRRRATRWRPQATPSRRSTCHIFRAP